MAKTEAKAETETETETEMPIQKPKAEVKSEHKWEARLSHQLILAWTRFCPRAQLTQWGALLAFQ